MPGKPKPALRGTADISDNIDTGLPTWDTSDNSLGAHLRILQRRLGAVDARYVSLNNQGIVLDKRNVCCVSDKHIDRVRQGLILDTHGFLNPCIIGRHDVSTGTKC